MKLFNFAMTVGAMHWLGAIGLVIKAGWFTADGSLDYFLTMAFAGLLFLTGTIMEASYVISKALKGGGD